MCVRVCVCVRERENVNVRKVRECCGVQLVLLLSINNGLMTSGSQARELGLVLVLLSLCHSNFSNPIYAFNRIFYSLVISFISRKNCWTFQQIFFGLFPFRFFFFSFFVLFLIFAFQTNTTPIYEKKGIGN